MNKSQLHNNNHYREWLAHELPVIGRLILLLIIIATLKWGISPYLNDVYYFNSDVAHSVLQLVNDFSVVLVCYFTILAVLYALSYRLIPENGEVLSKGQLGLLLTTCFFDAIYRVLITKDSITLLFTLYLLGACVTDDEPLVAYNTVGQITSFTLNINQAWSFVVSIVAMTIAVISLYSIIRHGLIFISNNTILHKPTTFLYEEKCNVALKNRRIQKNRKGRTTKQHQAGA